MSLFIFMLFLIFIMMGVPVVASLLGAPIIIALFSKSISLKAVPTLLFSSINSFVLVVVPLFMLAGKIMSRGGLIYEIFDFANNIAGWMRGGLGAVNVLASMIFGGMSGSSAADAAGLGPIEIEAMTKFGYPLHYSAAITLASCTLSVVIPPSVLMVIYAIVAEVSVGRALIAGLFPGILITVILMIGNYFFARKDGFGTSVKFNIKNLINSTKKAFFALLTPIILLVGIFSGVFTATEASAITVFYALSICFFHYKTITFKDLKPILISTGRDASIALSVLASASFFVHILTMERAPDKIAGMILSISPQASVFLIIVSIFLIVVGMFMSITLSLIILTPIFLPAAMSLGINPVHFGVIMVAALAIGLITPPVGSCLYIICGVTRLPLEQVSKHLIPFYLLLYVALLIIMFVPQLSLFLPNLIWG